MYFFMAIYYFSLYDKTPPLGQIDLLDFKTMLQKMIGYTVDGGEDWHSYFGKQFGRIM